MNLFSLLGGSDEMPLAAPLNVSQSDFRAVGESVYVRPLDETGPDLLRTPVDFVVVEATHR
jgi:hypothetical protein